MLFYNPITENLKSFYYPIRYSESIDISVINIGAVVEALWWNTEIDIDQNHYPSSWIRVVE